ncbi:hypothetical protein ACJJTC_013783 [Scirpophaga incertulas]
MKAIIPLPGAKSSVRETTSAPQSGAIKSLKKLRYIICTRGTEFVQRILQRHRFVAHAYERRLCVEVEPSGPRDRGPEGRGRQGAGPAAAAARRQSASEPRGESTRRGVTIQCGASACVCASRAGGAASGARAAEHAAPAAAAAAGPRPRRRRSAASTSAKPTPHITLPRPALIYGSFSISASASPFQFKSPSVILVASANPVHNELIIENSVILGYGKLRKRLKVRYLIYEYKLLMNSVRTIEQRGICWRVPAAVDVRALPISCSQNLLAQPGPARDGESVKRSLVL